MKTPVLFKRIIAGTVLVFVAGSQLSAQGKKLNVLFIGNSYTGTNDLPGMTKSMALSAGDTLIVDSYTPGGYTLKKHSSDATATSKIGIGTWNYVVLQDQSQSPSLPDSWVDTEVKPYARKLDTMIHKANKCGRTVFYQTWGYKEGDASNCGFFPPVCTYAGMDSMLKKRYTEMAIENNALLTPAGSVWKEIRKRHPAINLYQADGSHPTAAGTFAAAATFYTILFRNDPKKITFTGAVPAVEAGQILQVVYDSVYMDLKKFFVYKYDPAAKFTASATGLTATFNSAASANAVIYSWTFGDGNTDATANPVHTYAAPGTYTVRLIIGNCHIKDTVEQKITVLKTGTAIAEQSLLESISIYPNPVRDIFTIRSAAGLPAVSGTLSDIRGAVLLRDLEINQAVNLGHFAPGLYLLRLEDKETGAAVTHKMIKE